MSYTIAKRFSFAAAHHLDGLAEGHKCSRPHGHTYIVEVRLESQELDAAGMVTDFADLAPLGRYIETELDHRDLNQVLDFQPSCEKLARHFYDWCVSRLAALGQVIAVRVSESPATWAEYRPQHPRTEGAESS